MRRGAVFPDTFSERGLIGQHALRPVMRGDSERSRRGRLTNPDDLRERSYRSKQQIVNLGFTEDTQCTNTSCKCPFSQDISNQSAQTKLLN